jgi:hypothetical protein
LLPWTPLFFTAYMTFMLLLLMPLTLSDMSVSVYNQHTHHEYT